MPARTFLPYLGDYVRMIAVGTSFYGVFCGNNTPDLANFPSGVTYQRNANWATKTLLSTDGVTHVPISIDPFFFEWSPPIVPIGVHPPSVAVAPITREPVITKPQPISIVDPPPKPIGSDEAGEARWEGIDDRPVTSGRREERVMLVSMPFGALERPSLALGLLTAHCRRADVACSARST